MPRECKDGRDIHLLIDASLAVVYPALFVARWNLVTCRTVSLALLDFAFLYLPVAVHDDFKLLT